jgi:hypothetical protein
LTRETGVQSDLVDVASNMRQVLSTGETNLWRAVHMPQTIIQQLLQQGTDSATEFGIPMDSGEAECERGAEGEGTGQPSSSRGFAGMLFGAGGSGGLFAAGPSGSFGDLAKVRRCRFTL